MPQIIKHRRGPIATLKAITPYRGEVVFTTSSLGDIIGPNLHIGDGTQQGGFLVNRLQYGATPPALAGVNTVMNDIPFYDTDDKILYRLNSGGHVNLDLTGNIKDRTVAGTLDITGRLDAQADLQVTGSAYISENIQLDDNKLIGIDSDTDLIQLKANEVKIAGMLSASSDLWVGGNVHAVGNVTFEAGSSGTITLGSGADDDIAAAGDFVSSLIPNASNLYDLGSTGQRWNNLWMSGSLTVNGGPHDIDSDSTIAIDSVTSTTINATTTLVAKGATGATFGDDVGTWEFDGAGALSETGMTTFAVTPSGTLYMQGGGVSRYGDDTAYWNFDGAGAVSTTGITSFDLDGSGAISVNSSTGIINIGNDDIDQAINVGTQGVRSISVGNALATAITADALAITLTSANALTATDGTATFTLAGTGATSLSGATTLDLDSTGAMALNSSGGSIGIGNDANAQSINIGTGAAARTITIGNLTGASAVNLNAGTGGIALASTGAGDIVINSDDTLLLDSDGVLELNTSGGAINIGTDAVAVNTTIGNSTGATAVGLTAGTGGITMAAGAASSLTTTAGAITVDGKTGITFKESGVNVIAIDTARDVLFSQTGGSSADPDVEFDGYVRFDGTTEFDGAVDLDSTLDVAGLTDFQDDVHVYGDLQVTGSTYVAGNLEVLGTTTTVDSTTVQIGDNILELNTAAAAADAGIYVYDTTEADQTGSILWDRTGNWWKGGIKDSEYRLPEQAAVGNLTEDRLVIADANGRLESSANVTDNGTNISFNNKDLVLVNKLQGVDANTFVDLGDSTKVVTKGGVQPSAHNADDLGITGTRYKNLWLQGNADLEGDIDVNGTANLDAVDIDGATQIDAAVTVGVNDIGYDVKFFGATAGQHLLWNQATDELVLAGDSKLSFHDQGGGENIIASADGHLEINAGTTLDITAPTVDVNVTELNIDGNVDLNGTLDVSGVFDYASTGTFNDAVTFAAASDMTLNFANGTNAPQMMWRNPSDAVRFVATPPSEDLNGDVEAHSSGSLLLYDGVDGFYHTRIIDGGQF